MCCPTCFTAPDPDRVEADGKSKSLSKIIAVSDETMNMPCEPTGTENQQMRKTTLLICVALLITGAASAQITEIIDASGDGTGNTLTSSGEIAVDGSGNVYVAGIGSSNAFKITSGGVITEIIDATGDGTDNTLNGPTAIAVDGSGNVYVTGWNSDNAFKITSGGVINEIIDAAGDGTGNTLAGSRGIAVDGLGNVYVTGSNSNNAFKITGPNIFADDFESGDIEAWSGSTG